ncbi:MAG: hypothetical protein AAF648_17450 [Pseudomonadota bacterium]
MPLLTACGSSDSSNDPADGAYQFVNALPDSPTLELTIRLDDDLFQSVPVFGYQQSTSLQTINRDVYTYEVSYVDPISGDSETLLPETEFEVLRDTVHTFVLTGSFATPQVQRLEASLDVFDADEDEIQLRALNLSSETAVIYLGGPDAGLNGDTLLATLAPGVGNDALLREDPEDSTYRLRVTAENSAAVVYDSGEFDIAARSRRLIVLTDAVGPDARGPSVFLVSEAGASAFTNAAANSAIQLLSVVSQLPSIEAQLTNTATEETLVVADLSLGVPSSFTAAEPGFITLTAADADGLFDATSTISIDEDAFYTVVVGDGEDRVTRANRAEYRRVATQTAIEFINGLEATDDEDVVRVDLYALDVGDSLADAAPIMVGVEFLSSVNSTVPATTLDLVVTTSGTESILAGPLRVSFPDREARLISVTEAAGGGLPNQILVAPVALP